MGKLKNGFQNNEKYNPAISFICNLSKWNHSDATETVISRCNNIRFEYKKSSRSEILINHLIMNGIMEEHLLYEPPFTDIHYMGLDGVFPKLADQLIAVLKGINRSAVSESGISYS